MELSGHRREQWPDMDLAMMRLTISLASQGRGSVSPNPMVGAVLVDGTGAVVAEGWHHAPGSPHAEVDVLAKVGFYAPGCTLYVNLEPCNHTGRTGPCTEVIIKSGVRRVVVGTVDPNPLVRGNGIGCLAAAGIQVETGCCEEECRRLNQGFARHVTSGLPLVTLKAAVSLDGRMACASGDARWVSSPGSRQAVMALRATHDAIMVGAGTAIADNPALTVREIAAAMSVSPSYVTGNMAVTGNCATFGGGFRQEVGGAPGEVQAGSGIGVAAETGSEGMLCSVGHCEEPLPIPQPVRILLDSHLRVPLSSRIFGAGGGPTWVFCGTNVDPSAIRDREVAGVRVYQVPVFSAPLPSGPGMRGVSLEHVLAKLGELGLNSILCEGGGGLFGSFFRYKLGDRMVVFVAPKVIGDDGIPLARFPSPPLMADSMNLQKAEWSLSGVDMRVDGLLPWAEDPWDAMDHALGDR